MMNKGGGGRGWVCGGEGWVFVDERKVLSTNHGASLKKEGSAFGSGRRIETLIEGDSILSNARQS